MWWNDGNESMDDWILNQWPRNDGKGFGKNKQSKHWIFNDHWTKWNGMKRVDPMMELLRDLDKISENGRNIYESNQINQSILEIDFDWTHKNEPGNLTVWRFGISKYHQYSILRNTFQCHYTRKFEIMSRKTYNGC